MGLALTPWSWSPAEIMTAMPDIMPSMSVRASQRHTMNENSVAGKRHEALSGVRGTTACCAATSPAPRHVLGLDSGLLWFQPSTRPSGCAALLYAPPL